ncbi:MAG: HAD hydrolase family protein [Candidatus Adiutrix sp.]|jgi:hydroxymethylpyrimidine pyrophosphatase-like HAD family hydrolase|nr:HAD hydrolase family protein [Candidatus Adiutrix sp.]
MTENIPKIAAAFFTDFDGTIKPEDPEGLAPADIQAFKDMGAAGWVRVVATGRSLFGFAKAWPLGLELDWLIFSSGAGLCSWGPMGPGPLLTARVYSPAQAEAAVRAALALGHGFSAYAAPPDNHHFYYHFPERPSAGFLKRLEIFAAQSRPWPADGLERLERGSLKLGGHLLIMVPEAEVEAAEAEFLRLAPGLSIVQASSPFSDSHRWLEIFPPNVSKGRAAADLVRRLGLDPALCAAAGNDYNDRDLLDWAGKPFITADAPPDLRSRGYRVIPPAGRGGLAEAWGLVGGRPATRG